MRIVFLRGFGRYLPDIAHDVPDPIADIHLRAGRARVVVDDRADGGRTSAERADNSEDDVDDLITDPAGLAVAQKPAKTKKRPR